jgi:Protein of unknown function (DUF3987)
VPRIIKTGEELAMRSKNTPKEALVIQLDRSWAEPDESLIEDRRGELPEFPIETFPPRLLRWLLRAARGAGVRYDHIAIPLLAATSSLIGTARRVQATTAWLEPVTLWSCVVAPSGDRKTPGLKVLLRALDRIEEENAPQNQEAHRAHQMRAQVAKEAMKRWRKACHEAVNANPPQDPPTMPIDAVDIGDFIEPALHVQDATIQRLGKLCLARPRGMLVIRDELSGLFAGMSRQLGARAFYLESWVGSRFVVERVDDDRSFTVPNLLVGVTGGFQPDKIARAFAGDEDGMAERFLFGWPASPDYYRLTDEVSEVEPEFKNLLMHLIRLPDEDPNGRFAPRVIALSAAARNQFEGYRRYVDDLKRSLDGRERSWLVKSETQVLRLAAVLCYLKWASDVPSGATGFEAIAAALEPDEIAELPMVNAIALMREYFWPHARAALRLIGASDRYKQLRRALRWIQAHRISVVSLKDIRREALAGSLDADQTRDLMDRLVVAGWLRPNKTETGGRPQERWLVHPKIFETAPAETAKTAERV